MNARKPEQLALWSLGRHRQTYGTGSAVTTIYEPSKNMPPETAQRRC